MVVLVVPAGRAALAATAAPLCYRRARSRFVSAWTSQSTAEPGVLADQVGLREALETEEEEEAVVDSAVGVTGQVRVPQGLPAKRGRREPLVDRD